MSARRQERHRNLLREKDHAGPYDPTLKGRLSAVLQAIEVAKWRGSRS